MRRFIVPLFSLFSLLIVASAVPVAAVANDGRTPTATIQPKLAFLVPCADGRPESGLEQMAHVADVEEVRRVGGGTTARENACPGWVYHFAVTEIERGLNEECGPGNSHIGPIYCIELQEGGYHVMAEATCLS